MQYRYRDMAVKHRQPHQGQRMAGPFVDIGMISMGALIAVTTFVALQWAVDLTP
jgi:hypothetical protein